MFYCIEEGKRLEWVRPFTASIVSKFHFILFTLLVSVFHILGVILTLCLAICLVCTISTGKPRNNFTGNDNFWTLNWTVNCKIPPTLYFCRRVLWMGWTVSVSGMAHLKRGRMDGRASNWEVNNLFGMNRGCHSPSDDLKKMLRSCNFSDPLKEIRNTQTLTSR